MPTDGYATTDTVNGLLGVHAATATTPVTLTQLESMIEGVSFQMDFVLRGVDVDLDSLEDDFQSYLAQVNAWGAAAEYLKASFPEASGLGESPAYAFWEKKYQDAIKAFRMRQDIPSSQVYTSPSRQEDTPRTNPELEDEPEYGVRRGRGGTDSYTRWGYRF